MRTSSPNDARHLVNLKPDPDPKSPYRLTVLVSARQTYQNMSQNKCKIAQFHAKYWPAYRARVFSKNIESKLNWQKSFLTINSRLLFKDKTISKLFTKSIWSNFVL